MNVFLETLALVWLLVLTIGFLALVRYLAVAKLGGAGRVAPEGGFLFDTDGPDVPSTVPAVARLALDDHQSNTPEEMDLIVTFFSSHCGGCLEHAEHIADRIVNPAKNVFLVTGLDDSVRATMQDKLRPAGGRLLFDPNAHDIVKSFGINSTPFALRILNGEVVAKSFIRSADDYVRVARTTKRDDLEPTSEVANATSESRPASIGGLTNV